MTFAKTHDIEDISAVMIGETVTICGWIEDVRKMGKMTFVIVRDVTGRIQAIARGDMQETADGTSRQSVVRMTGKIQDTRARDFDFELSAESMTILSEAQHPLPIDPIGRLESGTDNRLNARALDMRNQRTAAIFKMRHRVLESLRKTLTGKKFIEINTPKIIGSASEGGANLFSLEYFGKPAYLAQSPQLYKEQMTLGLERVFEIASFYRAENSHTGRHLAEFTSVDIEAAFMDYTDVMDVLESLMVDLYGHVAENCTHEQEAIGHKVATPVRPFERVSYSQVIDELNSMDQNLQFGEDLTDSHLRFIGEKHPGFFFLVDWPQKLKPFYIREKDDNPELSRSFDLQFGYLELSSGGTRLHDPSVLRERLAEQGLNPGDFEDHLRTFDWGMPPHSGWGLGLERVMTTLTGIDNVRETVLYPRDTERLFP